MAGSKRSIAYVKGVANGDLTVQMDKASHDDQIHEWLMLLKSNIGALVADANMLAKAAVEGKLATRADATKHQGDYRKIVEGVNDTLDAVIGPLNVAAELRRPHLQGRHPAEDHRQLQRRLQRHQEQPQPLHRRGQHAGGRRQHALGKAAVEGKLATRADATKHQGDFRKIVQGVNDTLDAVIGPLNVAANYVDQISKGDYPSQDHRHLQW